MEAFERYLAAYFAKLAARIGCADHRLVVEAMLYSTAGGGKRFRPSLVLATTEALGKSVNAVMPFALAVELVHTYSLIHDDLPCMDNDDVRRGRPTNHKQFGEATALLAGDALLTESFALAAQACVEAPDRCVGLIQEMVRAIGAEGMVGGQTIDILLQKQGTEEKNLDSIKRMHRLKTSELIRFSVWGAAWISGCDEKSLERLNMYGTQLGYAFQVADDLIDLQDISANGCGEAAVNSAWLTSRESATQALRDCTDSAVSSLGFLGAAGVPLQNIAEDNAHRATR